MNRFTKRRKEVKRLVEEALRVHMEKHPDRNKPLTWIEAAFILFITLGLVATLMCKWIWP